MSQTNSVVLKPVWYSPKEAAALLGFSLSKTKMLILEGRLKSLKDGRHRRILPQWIDEYVQLRAEEAQSEFGMAA